MFEFLKSQNFVEPDQQSELISQMLARHIPAKDAYNFYWQLRKESEQQGAKRQSKSDMNADEPKAEKPGRAKKGK